jgi:murein DD-endopeptidase MepM/ murein hydrolase activator NlpD
VTDATARRIVLGSMLAAGATVVISGAAKGELPKPRRLLALGVVYIALAALADTQPAIAAPVAGLVGMTVVLGSGGDAAAGVLAGVTSTAKLGTKDVPTPGSMAAAPLGSPGVPLPGGGTLGGGGPQTIIPTPGARRSPPLPGSPRIIGTPYSGTHTRGNWQSDNAVDLSTPVGTPVLAVRAGVIGSQIGPLSSSDPALAGLRVNLSMSEGGGAYYAHLSRLVVRAGQRVVAGQVLGYSGSANGVAHLHFAVEPPRSPSGYLS